MKQYKSTVPELSLKYKSGETKKVKISSSADINEYLNLLFNSDTIEYSEEFIAVFLNRANNTIGWSRISTGGVAGTVVDPKVVFSQALLCGASSIILAHNHPSGNLKPSQADIKLTKKLKQGGEYLDIQVLDHLIVTISGYYSFADQGMI